MPLFYHHLKKLGEISTKLASLSIFSPTKRTKCHINFLWHPFIGWVMSANKTHSWVVWLHPQQPSSIQGKPCLVFTMYFHLVNIFIHKSRTRSFIVHMPCGGSLCWHILGEVVWTWFRCICNGTLYNVAQCEPFGLTYSYTNSQYSCVIYVYIYIQAVCGSWVAYSKWRYMFYKYIVVWWWCWILGILMKCW
jgi:hypothetical protein